MTNTVPPSPSNPSELGFEDIADRMIPAEPRISPDGRMVAMSVGARSRKDEHSKRALWLSRDGEHAWQFTGGEWNDHDIAWSPDGSRLAFLSNRKEPEKEALYIIEISGGEARQLGEIDGALGSPTWSPDGTTIAFLRTDPETEEEEKRKKDKDDPITVEVDLKVNRLWLADVASGKTRCLTFGSKNVWDFCWNTDGESLVYTTTTLNTINATCGPGAIWAIPASGGVPKRVADATPLPESPVVRETRDGPVVAVISSVLRDDPARLVWTAPLSGGDLSCIISDYPGSVAEMRADPSSDDSLVLRMVEGTHARAYTLRANGKKLKRLKLGDDLERGSVVSGPTLSADGKRATWVASASDRPEEVFTLTKRGGATAITDMGKTFTSRLAPGEIIRWTSDDGTEIEGVLIRPRGDEAGNPVPLVVQVHGGPSWQWEDRVNLSWHDWSQMLASRGYATLMPNPRGSTGYGSAFERLLIDDVGGGESRDLVSGARAMVDRGIADPDRFAIGGWSWGGYLTAWTITQTSIFKAAIMGAGVANLVSDHAAGDIPQANTAYYTGTPYALWDLYADRSPVRHASKVTTPTLILHGDTDARVSPTQGLEYFRALQTIGVPVEFIRYPREGHGINERAHQLDLMRRIIDWLTKYVPA